MLHGQLIPTIMGLQKKLQTFRDDEALGVTKPLTEALLNGTETRFDKVMTSDNYRIASVLHPKFKLAFLPVEDHIQCKEVLLSYVERVHRELHPPVMAAASASASSLGNTDAGDDENDLYSFLRKSHQSQSENSVSDQVCNSI